MDTFLSVINIFITFYLISMAVNLFIRARRNAKEKDDELQKNNIEKAKAQEKEVVEMVRDEVCGNAIPKLKAYILNIDNHKHYFCSWECREKFRGQKNGNQ